MRLFFGRKGRCLSRLTSNGITGPGGWGLVLPSFLWTLSRTFSSDSPSLQILWTFSIYLESVAVMPQLYMISKTGEAETITSHYLFALGSYRALYIINWAYRFYMEDYYDIIAIVAGGVQTALYCDFFYLYITKGVCVHVCACVCVRACVRACMRACAHCLDEREVDLVLWGNHRYFSVVLANVLAVL